MTSLPPQIDQRSYEEIIDQTEKLVQQFTDWKPINQGETDAAGALIRIYSRMIKLISDRINKVPDKNFLAFLDLIGGQLIPPQAANVPLKFHLAEGSPVDGIVPAYTQVSAPPAEGSDEEIIFETKKELVVTTTQLKSVLVRDPFTDHFKNCTLEATGQQDSAFLAFEGEQIIPHYLYLTFPEIFTLPELENLQLIINDSNNKFHTLPLNWSYSEGDQWHKMTSPRYNNNRFTFSNLSIPAITEVNGKSERWLQVSLENLSKESLLTNLPQLTNIEGSVTIEKLNLIPDICLFNGTPLDLTKDFAPFGDQPQLNDTFYIALHDSFIKGNTIIKINLELSHKPVNIDQLRLIWEIGNGREWQEIAEINEQVKWIENSSAIQFTESENIEAQIQFPNLENLPSPSTVNGETRYWLRGRIIQGHYGKPASQRQYPIYDDLAALTKKIEQNDTQTASDGIKITLIQVDSLDLFQVGDIIRLLPITGGFPEEHKLKKINLSETNLTLEIEGEILNDRGNLSVGTRIMRKSILTEIIPATYDPPLIKSLNLTYHFTLREKAIYLANNDFNYFQSNPFTSHLTKTANEGDQWLILESVEGLSVGEFLTINSDIYQIELINQEDNQVIINSPINQKLSRNTAVNRYFQPFTPSLDQDSTLYLGFDNNFNNKTVTLYAQIDPPFPDELSTDIISETVLTEAVTRGQNTIKLADSVGLKIGDHLEIKNPVNSQQSDQYKIVNIETEDNQLTIYPSLLTNYPENNPVIYPTQPELVWEYSSPLGWQPLGVQDETQSFSQSGLIQFIAPEDFNKINTFGQPLYWLRIRWQNGNFRVKPRLRQILTNTTLAVQATTFTEEILGSSNADPNQILIANNTPILMGQQLEIQEEQIPLNLPSHQVKIIKDELGEIEEIWIIWQEVTDFYNSNESDRHYILDRQTGKISFGDGFSGMIPPRGRNNIKLSYYRIGGGKQGNVAVETINQLKTTIPYIDQVINIEAAAGGSEQETLESFKQRIPKQLRHRNRAVTIEDFEDLAYEASTDIARVKVVTPDLMTAEFSSLSENLWLDPNQKDISLETVLVSKETSGVKSEFIQMMRNINRRSGEVKVIILPDSKDRQPIPSLALLRQVDTYIRSRCEAMVNLIVTAPKWQEVTLKVTITPDSFDEADRVRNLVKQTLTDFLHPLTGDKGKGWQLGGRYPQESDFYALIQSISGVNYVNSLEIITPTETHSPLSADTLIYSGDHLIYLN